MSTTSSLASIANLPSATGVTPAATTGQTAQIQKVAQQFEALMLRQMLASARQASGKDALFSSQAQSTFSEMADARFADLATKTNAIGLARMIAKQLSATTTSTATTTTTTPQGGQ
jgi:flagellar protein FlgJ